MTRPTDEQIRQAEEAARPESAAFWLTLALAVAASVVASMLLPPGLQVLP